MNTIDPILDDVRLEALWSTGLLDQNQDTEFDRITALAAQLLDVPVCLVSLVDANRQVFTGSCGLPPDLDELRETPLSHSFCQHAVREGRPLIIENALEDSRVAHNLAIPDLGVIAYLGFPIIGPKGQILGSFCVIDHKPRVWTIEEIARVRDFTAIVVQLIELHAADARKGAAIDVLTHDLSSPLASVRMAAELLEERLGTRDMPAEVKLLTDIQRAAGRALELLQSLAQRERDEQGESKLLSVVDEVEAAHAVWAVSKGVHFEHTGRGEDVVVNVPAWAATQAVDNLISNAIKFSPAGGTVRTQVTMESQHAVLTISDDGPGFTEADMRFLFRRYAQLSAAPTAGEASSGLGLSIAKRLIDQHGGNLELVSLPGESATFRMMLPRAKVQST